MSLNGDRFASWLCCIILILLCFEGAASDEVLLSCSFEISCGLHHANYSQYYWSSNSGPTPNQYTGPSADHTYGDRVGKYIYARSSQISYQFGQQSTLYSPEYQLTAGRGSLEFYYHMWDGSNPDDMGSLSVRVCGDTVPVWTRRRNQGNRWQWTGKIEFSCRDRFKIYFVATRGKKQSDIAIDDLIVMDIFDSPTTPLITTSVATSTPVTTTPPKSTTTAAIEARSTTSTSTASTTARGYTRFTSTRRPATIAPKTAPAASPKLPADGTAAPTVEFQTPKGRSADSRTGTWTETVSEEVDSSQEGTSEPATIAGGNTTTPVGDIANQKVDGAPPVPFVGPIVVICVAVLFLACTLCFAFPRRKSHREATASHPTVRYSVENPSYITVADSCINQDNPDTQTSTSQFLASLSDGYSYSELLKKSGGLDEVASAERGGTNGRSDAGRGVSKRRGESLLYEAIPDQDVEYEGSYMNMQIKEEAEG